MKRSDRRSPSLAAKAPADGSRTGTAEINSGPLYREVRKGRRVQPYDEDELEDAKTEFDEVLSQQ